MENIFAEEEMQIYADTVSVLKPYLHNIELKEVKSRIKYLYGNDNSIYLLWGKNGGKYPTDIANELRDNSFIIEAETEGDILFEINEAYREASKKLKEKTDVILNDKLTSEERYQLKQSIAKDILRAFDGGKKSKFASIVEEQSQKAKNWKTRYYELKNKSYIEKDIVDIAREIKDIDLGNFANATKFKRETFKGSIGKLKRLKVKGNINKKGTRKVLAGLAEWYSKDNPLLMYVNEENPGLYKQEITDILNAVAENEYPLTEEQNVLIEILQKQSGKKSIEDINAWYTKDNLKSSYNPAVKTMLNEFVSEHKFTVDELKGIRTVMQYFNHLIKNYDKVWHKGKLVDSKPLAENYIKIVKDNENVRVGGVGQLFHKFDNTEHNYMQTFFDPITIARHFDKYTKQGFFTETLESFREGAVNSAILEMELKLPFDEFYEKNKKYVKQLRDRTIEYNGVKIPVEQVLSLYCTSNREQALLGLAMSGFAFKDAKGNTIRIDGFETSEDATIEDMRFKLAEFQEELSKQFTETDKEFISLVEDCMARCKELKYERDIQKQGYSNIVEGYYYPIARDSATNIDTVKYETDRVSNLSFNKNATKGAKSELFIEPISQVVNRHVKGISLYYNLSNVVETFNIVYNLNVGDNSGKATSVKTESHNTWHKSEEYFKNMLADIQGVKKGRDEGLWGTIRGHYAVYQLGANPKVWLTQLSSFFASTSILDYNSIIKGFTINTKDVDKYCKLAMLRNHDNTSMLAQGVLNKVNKVGEFLMKPIGAMDRFVVSKLFGACQVQIQKDTGLKIGTEENKVKAGELLQTVILETQQNALATERSLAMRSTSELLKTLTMFTSDSMKVIGRVIDSFGELTTLKARKRLATNSAEIAELDKQIKLASKQAFKSSASLIMSAMFMAAIAQLFKHIYNKDEEDENVIINMLVDAFGNLFGGLPIFKDIIAKLTEGYDVTGYEYSAINDMLDAGAGLLDIFNSNDLERDIPKNIKKLSYAAGQLFGLPVRNVYNTFYGLTKRFSPSTAYKIDDVFYKQSYTADLKKAIENDDEDMISTIAGLLMDENVGAFENSSTRKEVNRLITGGYSVLPRTISNTMTIAETEYTLSAKDKEEFKKVYNQSMNAIDKMVASSEYKKLSDENKAKALKYVYNYYYYDAQTETLDVELDSKLYLFGQVVPIEKMALILAEVPTIAENTKDKKRTVQMYLQRCKLTAIQKYMLMGYFGYKNTQGESAVKSAINKTALSKTQKELLLEKCGY